MSGSPIIFKSIRSILGLFVLETLFVVFGGYWIVSVSMPVSDFDYMAVVLSFLGLPVCVAALAFFLGARTKRSALSYTRPDWQFQPLQFRIEECANLVKGHLKRYGRMVSVSRFWFFYTPVVLIVLNLSQPYYESFVNPMLAPFVPILSCIILLIISLVCWYGAFRATSNAASSDFTLPQIREAVWLAKAQSKVAGASYVRLLIDAAQNGELTVYRNPRVIVRISGLEDEAYIESWSDELKSMRRVFCGLQGSGGSRGTSWIWDSRDRSFVKQTPENEEGYYVRNPVRSRVRELGVKDIKLVTENAIALILIEYVSRGGNSTAAKDMLRALGTEHRNG